MKTALTCTDAHILQHMIDLMKYQSANMSEAWVTKKLPVLANIVIKACEHRNEELDQLVLELIKND